MIEFYLNGRHQHLDSADPNLSILEWLRTGARLTGTKEGCASGDCGACTVAIGSPDTGRGGALRYDSVNACIAPLGSLHGRHLVTVDGLQQEPPHPVQREMVECHGAQCGFCTPGIIMSLFALHTESTAIGTDTNDAALLEALSGNLCRCTGYRPIIEAGRRAAAQTWEPAQGTEQQAKGSELDLSGPTWLQAPEMLAALARIQERAAELEDGKGQRYDAPTSIQALRRLRDQHPEARLVAGGTDLSLEITQFLKDMDHLISVTGVDELQRIREERNGLYIGAAVSYREAEPLLSRRWPQFHAMIERLGSRQIRNRGTIGGNIGNASPIGDMPPALIALGAELELDSVDGIRRMPLQDFFHDYKKTDLRANEFIRGIWIPAPKEDECLYLYKISKRLDDDISAVLGAFWIKRDGAQVADCRLAFGGMAAIPKRAAAAETALRGKPWDISSVEAAITALEGELTPMSDVRGSSTYRLRVAGNLLRRALLESTRKDKKQPLMVTEYA